MLLECRIKRDGGTHTDMRSHDAEPHTTYHFKPIDPTRADSPHVAEVSTAHAQGFIAVAPDCYVLFEGAAPKADLARPKTVQTMDNSTPDRQTGTVKPAVAQATVDTGRMSVTQLSDLITSGGATQEYLRELLALEEESGEPRKNFVKIITQALK